MRQRQLQGYEHGQGGESEENVKHVTEIRIAKMKKREMPKCRWRYTARNDLKRRSLQPGDAIDLNIWQ